MAAAHLWYEVCNGVDDGHAVQLHACTVLIVHRELHSTRMSRLNGHSLLERALKNQTVVDRLEMYPLPSQMPSLKLSRWHLGSIMHMHAGADVSSVRCASAICENVQNPARKGRELATPSLTASFTGVSDALPWLCKLLGKCEMTVISNGQCCKRSFC